MILLAALALSLTPTQDLAVRSQARYAPVTPFAGSFGIELLVHPDGGVVLFNTTGLGGTGTTGTTARVFRIDDDGRELWQHPFNVFDSTGGGMRGTLGGITVLGDGAIVLALSDAPRRGFAYVRVLEPDGSLRFEREFPSPVSSAIHSIAGLGPVGAVDCLLHFESRGTSSGSNVSIRMDGASGADVWRRALDSEPWGSLNSGRAVVRAQALHFVARLPDGSVWAYKLDADGDTLYATPDVLPSPSSPNVSTGAFDVGPGGEVAVSSLDGASLLDGAGTIVAQPPELVATSVRFGPDGRVFANAAPIETRFACLDVSGTTIWQRTDLLRAADFTALAGGGVALLRPDTAGVSAGAVVTVLDAFGATTGNVRLDVPGTVRSAARVAMDRASTAPWFSISTSFAGPPLNNSRTTVFGLAGDAADVANFCGQPNPNSSGATGRLRAVGAGDSAARITLFADRLPAGQSVLFLNSRTTDSVFGVGGGLGRLCLGGTINRYNRSGEVQTSGDAGAAWLTLVPADTPDGAGIVSVLAGETWRYQAWHRDTSSGAQTSNLTGAVAVSYR